MKKLSAEEFSKLPLKGKGRSSELYNSIINLKINEALLIEPKDWKRKAGPSTLIKYIEKTKSIKLNYSALAEGQGWVVVRTDDAVMMPHQQVPASKPKEKPAANPLPHNAHNTDLKSELTIFYLGRISFLKIEKITDSVRAAQEHFRDESRALIKELLEEIITILASQKHIVVENEKTYVPLKKQ